MRGVLNHRILWILECCEAKPVGSLESQTQYQLLSFSSCALVDFCLEQPEKIENVCCRNHCGAESAKRVVVLGVDTEQTSEQASLVTSQATVRR